MTRPIFFPFTVAAFLAASLTSPILKAQTTAPEATPAQPAAAPAYTSALSADPIHLLWGWLDASYEHRLGDRNSLLVFGTYWGWADWSAFGLGASYRWYLDVSDLSHVTRTALEGFSVGPVASVAFWSWKGASWLDAQGITHAYGGGASFQFGASAAYKWVFSGGWFVEPNVTLLFNLHAVDGFSGYTPYGFGGNIGYAWH